MKKFSKVLSLLLVFAMIVPGIAQAATVDAEEAAVVTRISGGNRYQTAANVSNQKFGKSKTVVLASGENWPDALAGTALAGVEGAPILLTAARRLHPDTKAELISLGAEKVIIVGGETVIPAAVADELKAMGLTVDRKEGLKREDTAVAAAKGMTSKTAIIANGYESFADALSAGAYAGMNGMPILFVRQNSVPAGTLEGLKALGIENVIIAGGTSAVSAKVQSELAAYNPTRIYGEVREETSLAFAEKFENNKEVIIANGYDYADALAGAALGAKIGAPVVLVNTNSMKTVVEGFIKENADKNHTVIGGTSAVSNNVVSDIEEIVVPVEEELKVVSVSAINPKEVKVTFNKEVEALTTADVTVTNTKTAEKQFVKEVKLAEDKKSATVTFYNDLVNKTTYNVEVKDAGNMDLNYTVGEAATITAKTTQVVKAANDIDLNKLDYKVLDANGLDITDTTSVSFETTATVGENGKDDSIKLTNGQSAFVYVVATKEDGTKVKSPRITVKAEALKAAAITEVTVSTEASVDFTDKDYKQNLVLPVGEKTAKVYLAAEDQFGDTFSITGAEFESLDKSVALVDRTTGVITPLKEGTVPVRVTLDKVTKTVQLQVVANAKATSVELEEEVIKLSNKVLAGQNVKVQVNDQYGNVFTTASNPTVTVLTGKDLITADATVSLTGGKGTLNIAPKTNATAGTATVEVKVSDTIKAVLTVNVTEAGAIDSYTVEGFESKLDKNTTNDKTKSEFTLNVYPVDKNGVKTGDAVNNAKYTITDKDGKEVVESTATSTKIDAANNTHLKAGETYTIAVKVGTLEIFKDTFTVENTSAKPSLVQKESSVVVNDTARIDFSKLFIVNFEGKEVTNYTVTAIEATSDNSAVATTFKATDAASKNVEFTSTKDGSATVILQSVTLSIIDAANNPYEVKLNNVPVNVKVGIIKTAAETKLVNELNTTNIDTNPPVKATGNFLDITSNNRTVKDGTITVDFDKTHTSNGIKALYNALTPDQDGKVNGKDAKEYAIDRYVMNTFARYMGSIDQNIVKEIQFNGVTYGWDMSQAPVSKWYNGNTSLVSAVVLEQNTTIRNVTFTAVTDNEYSVIGTFKAINVPAVEDIDFTSGE